MSGVYGINCSGHDGNKDSESERAVRTSNSYS